MTLQQFVKTNEWSELKEFLKQEIIDKPLKVKTDGMSIDRIALEVRALQIAADKINKAIKKIDRMGMAAKVDDKPYI